MKKILIKILVCLMAIFMALGVGACGGDDWDTTMTTPGNRIVGTNGGFVAETENYVYYINGYTSYGDDNTFGEPVKGALMAAEKSSFLTGNVKTEVVVPKLFVSTDYNAGVFIYGNYVYYGTPSTDKNNEGDIARGEMTFTRTKLDGSETQTFFTVDALSYTYRFVESNGVVYLVYYDPVDQALYCYNTSNDTTQTIAKTAANVAGKFESLEKYSVLPGEGKDALSVIYTVTVYAEPYLEEAANREGYERATDSYNKVYAYRVGDKVATNGENRGTVLFDGSKNASGDLTYAVILFTNDFFAYSKTDVSGKSETRIVKTEDVVKAAKGQTADLTGDKVDNTTYLTTSNVIKEDYTVYTIVSGEDVTNETGETVASADVFVVKTSLMGSLKNNFKRLAKVGTASSLYDIVQHGDATYAYYYNSMVNFARIKLNDVEESEFTEFYKEERISEDSVASAWYEPELITVSGSGKTQTFALYLDNTSKGASYVKYVKIYDSAKVGAEDTEDVMYNKDTGVVIEAEYKDEEETEIKGYALTDHKFIGEIISADTTNTAIAELEEIPYPLTWEVKNGEIVVDDEQVKVARAAYNALSDEGKEAYGEGYLARLEGAEKAVQVLKKLAKLDGIQNYEFYMANKPAGEADKYKAAYNEVKTVMEEIKLDNNVLDYIENNLKWAYYEKAVDLFA